MEKEFINLAKKIGKDPAWVQGPGGNISIKLSDDLMIVKSSGSELKDAKENFGYTFINWNQFKNQLEVLIDGKKEWVLSELDYSGLIERSNLDPIKFKRPSMELGFHTILKEKYVLHFHSLCSILVAYQYFQKNIREFKFEKEFEIGFLEFVLPGFLLSEPIQKLEWKEFGKPKLIFMQNHGVILAVNKEPEKYLDLFAELESTYWKEIIGDDYNFYRLKKNLHKFALDNLVPRTEVFPDSVVLESKMENIIEGSDLVKLKNNDYINADLEGVVNLFSVQSVLLKLVPDIRVLTEIEKKSIQNLPTEVSRKKIMGNLK